MNKKKAGIKLSRNSGSRAALLRSQVRALVLNEEIVTTEAKARMLVANLGRIIKKVAINSLAARREVLAIVGNQKEIVSKVFEIKPTSVRSLRMGTRRGDNAQMVKVTLIKKEINNKNGEK